MTVFIPIENNTHGDINGANKTNNMNTLTIMKGIHVRSINLFATTVNIVNKLVEIDQSFTRNDVASILSILLQESHRHYKRHPYRVRRIAKQYLYYLNRDGYIKIIAREYATFANGGNGNTTFLKLKPIPDKYLLTELKTKIR